MKKNVILISLLFISLISFGQRYIASGTFEPNDLGLGVRLDYKFNRGVKVYYHRNKFFYNMGIYTGVGYGKYNSTEEGQYNHFKCSAGITKYAPWSKGNIVSTFGAGINFHNYGKITEGLNLPSKISLFPVSLEANVGIIIYSLNIGISQDLIKRESMLIIGMFFK